MTGPDAPQPRLYLDNAATSFPKPEPVHRAMLRYMTEVGASPGRGSYAESQEGAELIWRTRDRIRRLINAESPESIVFTLNTSDALNIAIKGLVRHRLRSSPDRDVHLITTQMDHNSVLRPFNALADHEPRVRWTCVEVDPETGLANPDDIAAAIERDTALVAVVHASNVTGTIQPIGAIGKRCRELGVPLLVDAAQSIGHVPLDVRELCIDLLAFPGHKGLLGPLGTGGLYLRPGLERLVDPLREGGTGSVSELDTHPETMPDRYEPGSHNTPGIVGLGEGVQYLLDRGMDAVWAHERGLIDTFFARWHAGAGPEATLPGLRLLGPQGSEDRVGVFSVVHRDIGPAELAMTLEQDFGILVRPGIHCAPHAHRAMGTVHQGGATRLSVGPFVTEADVSGAVDALGQVCVALASGSTASQPTA